MTTHWTDDPYPGAVDEGIRADVDAAVVAGNAMLQRLREDFRPVVEALAAIAPLGALVPGLHCLLCGEPEDGHDEAACREKMRNWRPVGILGLAGDGVPPAWKVDE